VTESAEGFACFVADHGVFGEVGEDRLQMGCGVGVRGLAEAVGEFVFEEGCCYCKLVWV